MIRFIKLTIDENFVVGAMKDLRVNIEEISCYYVVVRDVMKRNMGALEKKPYCATVVNLKQGAEFYVKETPEEIDKLIDPVTYNFKPFDSSDWTINSDGTCSPKKEEDK